MPESYELVALKTIHDTVMGKYYPVLNQETAVIWIGGVGGDWDTPATNLYPEIIQRLQELQIASLWLRYQNPGNLETSIFDVLIGIEFLKEEGIKNIAIVGWSFGGAIAIQAAIASKQIYTVITISTQSQGTLDVAELPQNTPILLIHGANDKTLSPLNSELIFSLANSPKRLILLRGGHGLEESKTILEELILSWLQENIKHD
ncbi:MAG TPA: alpha/beta hydrolase [bacterium]|nr:alpha/beta hydrolase [bacterium]